MTVLVGADHHITTVLASEVGKGRYRKTWFHCTCTCGNARQRWTRDTERAQAQAEVHARLWHGAEPDRGKWGNPNVTRATQP